MVISDITSLPNRFYQPALSTAVGSGPSGLLANNLGQVVTDAEDINQCIQVILTTPKGADPHRPTFGSDLHLYIDQPVNSARPYIVREVVDALRAWEPRVDVTQVSVDLSDEAALACVVYWQYTADAAAGVFVANLSLGAA